MIQIKYYKSMHVQSTMLFKILNDMTLYILSDP